MAVVSQCGVANSTIVVMAKVRDRVTYLVEALDAKGGYKLARFEVGKGSTAAGWWREYSWVNRLEAGQEVDLAEREGYRCPGSVCRQGIRINKWKSTGIKKTSIHAA